MPGALSKTGERRLATFEDVIEKGLGTFIQVGGALQAIRDERLYRAEHVNFDDYLRSRWNMSRTYAHRLIEATEIAEALPIGNKPQTESQARALAPIKDDPAAMDAVMDAAKTATNGKPTAEAIKAEVVKVRPPKPEPSPEEKGLAAFTQSVVDKHPEWAITDAYFKATKHAGDLLGLKPDELVAAMGSDDINRDSLKRLASQFAEWADSVLSLLEPGLRRVK